MPIDIEPATNFATAITRTELSPEEQEESDQRTVFVSNLSPKIADADLYEFFAPCGKVVKVSLIIDRITKKLKGLYVGFLSLAINEEQIRSIFTPYGELDFINLHTKPGGLYKFAFVQFKLQVDAQRALSEVDGRDVMGKQIKVVFVHEDKNNPKNASTAAVVFKIYLNKWVHLKKKQSYKDFYLPPKQQ
eukprot:gene2262-2564_t